MNESSSSVPEPATEEQRAIQTLGLDEGANIETLISLPTARDLRQSKALLRTTPARGSAVSLDRVTAQRNNTKIVEMVRVFMAGHSTLLWCLGTKILRETSAEELRATPAVFLQRILDTSETARLADRLLTQLKWYGAAPGEQTPASIRHKLVCRAIRLCIKARSNDQPQDLAGFDWQDPAHWGKSYSALHSEFETHLVNSGRAQNGKDAILLAYVFQFRLSRDFAVRDIPSDLRYRSSVVWVNFMHGALLADALGLNRSQPLSFQQLVDLPLERSSNASPEQLESIARLRLGPALQWAICTGAIKARAASAYDAQDIRHAMEALESHSNSLHKAVTALDLRPPERLKMAKQTKDRLFGSAAYESDGCRLVHAAQSSGPRDTPTLQRPGYTFLDLYADGQFNPEKKWFVTQADGKTRTSQWLMIDHKRILHSQARDFRGQYQPVFVMGRPDPYGQVLPDINEQFENEFKAYLSTIRSAYQTVIASQLMSLPLADRQMLEQADVRLLRLRQKIRIEGQLQECEARKGFVLKATRADETNYYELIPSAGIIRRRTTLRIVRITGVPHEVELHASFKGDIYTLGKETGLLLDWAAHLKGTAPKDRSWCSAALDEVGHVPAPVKPEPETGDRDSAAPTANRLTTLASYIAAQFLYLDEQQLHAQSRGLTVFDTGRVAVQQRLDSLAAIVKGFVPFWGSLEDLLSGNTRRILEGAVGLLFDLATFLSPIGKFISGTVRLVKLSGAASQMAVKASLPSFSALTRQLLSASVKNLNPLDGLPTLLKSTASGIRTGLSSVGRLSLVGIKNLAHHVDHYRLTHNLPQAVDPGRWKALTSNDRLATVNGIDDVLVRITSVSDSKRLHLVDPATNLPYGPRLRNDFNHLTQGRTTFPALPPTQSHALAAVPTQAQIREMLEADGRTTLLIDDIPYRLDGDQLRRADLINDQALFKALPCRVRRAPDTGVCQTRFVTRSPASTPAVGSYDESKGWAPWFGDNVYTPANAQRLMRLKTLQKKSHLAATVEFQKGIYARIKASLPSGNRNRVDTFETGAIIIAAMDGSKHYVFTRVDAGSFYAAERIAGQGLSSPLTLRKASTFPTELVKELETIYTGSLNANNMVRIHGIETVERAMKTLNEIAIPIGGHAHPPSTLKWLKVDTSPGEAVLFDHSTRMIVSHLPSGATTWSRSREASPAFRQRVAQIFDTLFAEQTIKTGLSSDLKINKTMDKFQKLLPQDLQSQNARNIAFADVMTASGRQEVYVSVSGAQGLTGQLPLFSPPFATNGVIINGTTYFNIDLGQTFSRTSLNVSDEGKILAIPHTIKDIDSYTPAMTSRPTSLDSEAKLVSVLREKYPDPKMLTSVDVATTMPPCNSCSVVIKEFGYDGTADALQVLWG